MNKKDEKRRKKRHQRDFINGTSVSAKKRLKTMKNEGKNKKILKDYKKKEKKIKKEDDYLNYESEESLDSLEEKNCSNDSVKFAKAMSEIISSDIKPNYENEPILNYCIMDLEEKIKNKEKMLVSIKKNKNNEKGRIKEIIPLNDEEASKVLNYEKSLRKIAQKAVINLFNAIRAAQIKAEEASNDLKGNISASEKREQVVKMSKQTFFDFIKNKKS